MQCHQCQTTASPGARFCRHCGVALDVPEAADPPRGRSAGEAGSPRSDEPEDTITTSPEAPAGPLVCPACGADNHVRRELCGKCGADLVTGIAPPSAVDDAAPRPEPRGRGGTHGRGLRVGLAVAGALALVALIVVALSLAGLGPLAGVASLPGAEFDPEVYADEPAPLALTEIATSTTRGPAGGEPRDASQMADDDPATAWTSDGSRFEDGVGETIDLYLAEAAWVERLVVNNGLQRDAEEYAHHARIRRAEVLFDGGERISIRLEDLGLQRQAIELPEPRLTTTIRLEVTETFPGDTTPDLAVSDLGLEGWSAVGEDVEVARERDERARAAGRAR